jgi:cytochrome c553
MAVIASRLDAQEIAAVAAYYQQVPSNDGAAEQHGVASAGAH